MTKVVTGVTYPFIFNTPRSNDWDHITRVRFRTGAGIWSPLQALCLPESLSGEAFDLYHSFNAIPLSSKPYVLSFEGELPRSLFGWGNELVRKTLFPCLLSDRCRGLFPISQYSLDLFAFHSRDIKEMPKVRDRCRVIYPSIAPQVTRPRNLNRDKIVLTFVGAEWARKGGPVVSRLGSLLKSKNISVQINMISSFIYGERIYTDTDQEFYQDYLKLCSDRNVVMHGKLSNEEVLSIISGSDFCLLPTLDDSFGYNILESMTYGVPVIATKICAIPEMIDHLKDGILINLPSDQQGRWTHVYTRTEQRKTPDFQAILKETIDKLATEAQDQIISLLDNPDLYTTISQGAIQKINHRFTAAQRDREWHEIYKVAAKKF